MPYVKLCAQERQRVHASCKRYKITITRAFMLERGEGKGKTSPMIFWASGFLGNCHKGYLLHIGCRLAYFSRFHGNDVYKYRKHVSMREFMSTRSFCFESIAKVSFGMLVSGYLHPDRVVVQLYGVVLVRLQCESDSAARICSPKSLWEFQLICFNLSGYAQSHYSCWQLIDNGTRGVLGCLSQYCALFTLPGSGSLR